MYKIQKKNKGINYLRKGKLLILNFRKEKK